MLRQMILTFVGEKDVPWIETVFFGGIIVTLLLLLLLMIILRDYNGRDSKSTNSSRSCDTVRRTCFDVAVILASGRMGVKRWW